MKWLLRWPARIWLPVLLVSLSLPAATWLYLFQRHEYALAVEREEIHLLKERLVIDQTRLEVQLGLGNVLQVRRIVSSLGLRPYVLHAWLIGPDGRVSAALSRLHIGERWDDIRQRLPNGIADALATSALTPSPPLLSVRRLPKTELLLAETVIRPGHRLYLLSDLAAPFAERVASGRSVLWFLFGAPLFIAAVIGILLHPLWLRRAERLAAAAEHLGHGDFSARAALSGADELAHIGTAFDRMAERIAYQHEEIRRLAMLIEQSPLVAIIWDNAPGWPVVFISHNVVRWGLDRDALLANKTRFADLIHPEDLPTIEADVAEHLAHGPDHYVQEYRLRDGFGYWRWIEDHTWLVRNEQGLVVSIQGVLLDVTRRHEADAKLRQQSEELAARNVELERFAAAAIGRELEMIRLKREVNALLGELGRPAAYELSFLAMAEEEENA